MTDASDRLAQLADAVQGAGRASQTERLERVLLVTGSILLPLGVIIVMVGWYGAAHTPHLFEQVPYLISGGIFGATLAATGGFCYFGYWLTKLVHDQRAQTQRLESTLAKLEARMADIAAAAIHTASGNGHAPSGAASGGGYVATASGSMAHRPSCPIVTGKTGLRQVGSGEGMKQCKICEPDLAPVAN